MLEDYPIDQYIADVKIEEIFTQSKIVIIKIS
jgi:hypothetical protein